MPVSEIQQRLLVLGFEQDDPDHTALWQLGRDVLYALDQTLQQLGPITLFEPEDLRDIASGEAGYDLSDSGRKRAYLCQEYGCRYLLRARVQPNTVPNGALEGVTLTFELFDSVPARTMFHVDETVTAFEDLSPSPERFTLAWDTFASLVDWLTGMLLGSLDRRAGLRLWKTVETTGEVFPGFDALHRLQELDLSSTPEALSQRLEQLSRLVHDYPEMIPAQIALGLVEKRLQQYPKAISAFEQAYDRLPMAMGFRRAYCANEMGVCHALLEDASSAFTWWRRAIEQDPQCRNAYLNLAHALEASGDSEQAEAYFQTLTAIAPEDHRGYYSLARLYSKGKQWNKAILQYEHQLLIEPENAWTYCNLANCYLQIDGVDQAKAFFVKTLALDPDGEAGRFADFVLSGLQASGA